MAPRDVDKILERASLRLLAPVVLFAALAVRASTASATTSGPLRVHAYDAPAARVRAALIDESAASIARASVDRRAPVGVVPISFRSPDNSPQKEPNRSPS